jgi:hypothetical protein
MKEALPPSHAPALAGGPSIDVSYGWLTATLPARLHELAEGLPRRLGLTEAPRGGWGDFVGLHPNRELPVYAAQAAAGADGGGFCLPPEALHRFVYAHHVGGFYWLLRDRIEDGQVFLCPNDLVELGHLLGERWQQALAEATGSAELGKLLARQAIRRWQHGTERERSLLAASAASPGQYAVMVRDKLGWIAAPSQALLLSRGDPGRVEAFRQAHDLFLLALQTIDDVIDREEDRALRGCDVAGALRCTPGALLRVAPKLAARAGMVAAAGGFGWFAGWLGAFHDAIDSWRLEGDALDDELEAIGLAGEMEEAVLAAAPTIEPAASKAPAAPAPPPA